MVCIQDPWKRFIAFLLLTIALTLSSCMVGPDYQAPDTSEQLDITSIFYPDIKLEPIDQAEWWNVFEDELLSSLISMGEQNNLSVQIALAKIKESRAVLGVQGAELYPAVNANGDIYWGKESENINPLATSSQTKYSLSADAGWEIDLFGKIRRSIEAAAADYQASIEDKNYILISTRAEIAIKYLTIRSLQAQLKTAIKNIISQREMLHLTEVRYDNGIATYLDVAQASRVLATTEAELPLIRLQMTKNFTALAILTGESSDALRAKFQEEYTFPFPDKAIAIGIPAERIRQRPDVRRAERQLAAQTARIGVATADLYPSFSLIGTLGLASLSTGDLLQSGSKLYGIGPSLTWNIFDMGRIRQNIMVHDARTEQALLNYELTMLQAIKEVEDSLSGFHEQKERHLALTKSVEAAKDSLNMSAKLYKDGLTSFQDVLDAQRSLLSVENSLDQATGDAAIQLVSLYKSLAGGWTTHKSETTSPTPQSH